MIYLIAGARPNFMKIAPLVKSFGKFDLGYIIIHTGQHYDTQMSQSFFKDLDLPVPDISLGIGSGTHAEQTGKIMIAFERVCLEKRPDLVIVVGDVNSTVACALVAAKLGIPAAHVEAGLRSFDRSMPEEINRLLTDQISDILFTTCEDADENLRREGIPKSKIHFVGNVMIDTLYQHLEMAESSKVLDRLGLKEDGRVKRFALLTLHRPSNVDELGRLKKLLEVLNKIHQLVPIVFPAHPRTMKQIKKFDLMNLLSDDGTKINVIPPLGYLDFLSLMSHAKLVLTDSGGIQEETTILGIPCLTLRENTERPITIRQGTNSLVGTDPAVIFQEASRVLEQRPPGYSMPKYWDGKAADRILDVLVEFFKERNLSK
jgi:UDP-N-acetylglucosamine 2-epimerase (non-hydrolysing)